MNAKYLIILLLSMFLITACSTQNQAKSEKEIAVIQQVNEKVQSKKMKIEVNYANPMSGKSIYLSSNYDLTISGDSAIAYLPYFGRAYSAPYGGGEGGIKFKDLMKEYSATPKKKSGEWTVKFKIDTPDYNYDIILDIYSNGKSTVNVNSTQRQAISFNGDMVLED